VTCMGRFVGYCGREKKKKSANDAYYCIMIICTSVRCVKIYCRELVQSRNGGIDGGVKKKKGNLPLNIRCG